jgi:hypothetical protein
MLARSLCRVPRTAVLALFLSLICAVACASTPPAASRVVLADALTGSTQGERFGGQLTSRGYMPGKGSNHILYRLPQTVREGYLQIEVLGMDAALVTEPNDHGFLAMYDGRGVAEPAQYFRDLKSNYFRWNLHWRNRRIQGVKCVISCAAPTPNRLAAKIAQYPDDLKARDWTAEPTGKIVDWNPTRWHVLRLEWRNKTFRVMVDGVEVWQAQGPYDYAPVDHRVWIGSAPAIPTKYQSMIEGITYRNLELGAFAPSSTP